MQGIVPRALVVFCGLGLQTACNESEKVGRSSAAVSAADDASTSESKSSKDAGPVTSDANLLVDAGRIETAVTLPPPPASDPAPLDQVKLTFEKIGPSKLSVLRVVVSDVEVHVKSAPAGLPVWGEQGAETIVTTYKLEVAETLCGATDTPSQVTASESGGVLPTGVGKHVEYYAGFSIGDERIVILRRVAGEFVLAGGLQDAFEVSSAGLSLSGVRGEFSKSELVGVCP